MPRGVGHRPASHYGHEGFKWKDDLPPDYTADELRSYLPGRSVGVRFIEWYRQDVKGRGMTVPFMKYSGPGNPTNIGEPVNEADKFAKIHDLEYAYAKFRHNKGRITDDQLKKETDAADVKFLKSNGWNITSSMDPREQLASMIGALGIGVKYGTESAVGQIYPSIEKDNSMDIPTTSNNLANTLMKNLKANVSSLRESEEDRPMSATGSTVKASKSNNSEKIVSESANLPEEGGRKAAVPAPTLAGDVEMANLTGTGKEQASGGASSDGMMVHYIEKPLSLFGPKTSTYKKSHKFMTFGFADTFVTSAGADWALTSYLAEVPWHIPALYLNPSEYTLLSNSARVKRVSIEVIYRGSTIQFETAQSTTGLATLNQINDISVAHALNRTGWGSNVSYTAFNVAQPMLPTAIAKPKYKPVPSTYRGMIRDYYGADNNDNNFIQDVPKHQTGRQTFLYNYWATTARGPSIATNDNQFGGWPCLAEKINQMDGKTVVNQAVLKSTYHPKLAPLKPPLHSASHGLPFPVQNGTITVPIGGHLAASRQADITVTNVVPTASAGIQIGPTNEVLLYPSNAVTQQPNFDIYSPIEKCQIGRSGFWGEMDVHIQPSIHIGVQPVPALSSASLTIEESAFNSWTDTRAYWEVIATMEVYEHTPTAWPHATQPNVPLGENVLWINAANRPAAIVDASNDGATFAGLYTNSQFI